MQVIREMPLRCLFGLTNFKTILQGMDREEKTGEQSYAFLSETILGKLLPHDFYYRYTKV